MEIQQKSAKNLVSQVGRPLTIQISAAQPIFEPSVASFSWKTNNQSNVFACNPSAVTHFPLLMTYFALFCTFCKGCYLGRGTTLLPHTRASSKENREQHTNDTTSSQDTASENLSLHIQRYEAYSTESPFPLLLRILCRPTSHSQMLPKTKEANPYMYKCVKGNPVFSYLQEERPDRQYC